MNEKIFELLLNEKELSWRSILYDLVKADGMNPWHIDVSQLTKKYIQIIKSMKEHDLKVSGKIILAAAILLRIKSVHLIENDITKLDELIHDTEEEFDEDDIFEEFEEDGMRKTRVRDQYKLIPRNPQPRNRKVSIHDLVNALQRAMATKKRVLDKMRPDDFIMPMRKVDIMVAIRDVYHKIHYYSKKEKSNSVTFSKLLPPKAGKMDKVFTFLPLLHLENEHKVNLKQEKSFDEIHVHLTKNGKKAA